MAEFDDKLNAILGNPEIMGKIMSMAGSMNQQSAPPPPPKNDPKPDPGFSFDPGMIQKMMELMRSTQIDPRQQNLIRALHGFVPDDRLSRLEKAMQASRIARFASSALGSNTPGR